MFGRAVAPALQPEAAARTSSRNGVFDPEDDTPELEAELLKECRAAFAADEGKTRCYSRSA